MFKKELHDFIEIFLRENDLFFNHTYSIRTMFPCFSDGFKKSHYFKSMEYMLMSLNLICGYM